MLQSHKLHVDMPNSEEVVVVLSAVVGDLVMKRKSNDYFNFNFIWGETKYFCATTDALAQVELHCQIKCASMLALLYMQRVAELRSKK